MADDTTDVKDTVPAPPLPRKRHRGRIIVLLIIMIPVVIFALWIWVTLGYVYSTGERAGYVQKLSKKGWLCKTWEGELAMINLPGTIAPQIFSFTVRGDSLAAIIENDLGKRVSMTYDQHVGVPGSCFGETEYFVKDVRVVGP